MALGDPPGRLPPRWPVHAMYRCEEKPEVRKHATALNNTHYDPSPNKFITWTSSIATRKFDPKIQNQEDGYRTLSPSRAESVLRNR
jgi:hypothetical protein